MWGDLVATQLEHATLSSIYWACLVEYIGPQGKI